MDEQQEPSLATTGQARLVGRLSTAFYAAAATGAVIAQTMVAMAHIPWSESIALPVRVLVSGAGAATLELLAVVLAVMADYRMRLGERAVAVRVFSALVAIVATGVIVIGHATDLYLAAAFGTLSAAAYMLALVHMAARRRDALRAAGLLAQVPPSFGLYRWIRRPVLTARAAELARVQGLGLRESLRQAELELRAERRRPAIAAAVESAIRAEHDDPRMAEIAVSTLDLDRIAAELAATADYAGWAERLAPAVTAPAPEVDPETDPEIDPENTPETTAEIDPETGPEVATTSDRNSTRNTGNSSATSTRNRGTTSGRNRSGHLRKRAARLASREQGKSKADRIRTLLLQHPEMTQEQLAKAAGASDRYVRMVLGSSGTTSGQDTGNGSAASGQISGPVSGAVSAPVPAQMNGHHPEL